MANNDRDDRKQLLDSLFALLADVEIDYPEDVNAIIESVDIDPESYGKRMEGLARQTLKEQTRNEIEAARREYDERKRKTKHKESRASIMERIEEFFRLYPTAKQQLGVAHRNLETASDEDLQSLLDDLEYLVASEDSSDDE